MEEREGCNEEPIRRRGKETVEEIVAQSLSFIRNIIIKGCEWRLRNESQADYVMFSVHWILCEKFLCAILRTYLSAGVCD